MLRRLYIWLFLVCSIIGASTSRLFAQNLVINGDFEKYSSLPIDQHWHQIALATGWSMPLTNYNYYTVSYNVQICAVEYFNSKNPYVTSHWSVPHSDFGDEFAHSGKGYAGLNIVDSGLRVPKIFESNLLQGSLKPLEVGKKYYYEMFISLGEAGQMVAGNIGVLFSDTAISPINPLTEHTPLYGITPDIIDTSYIIQTNGWYKISGNYTARGTEQYLFIGQFSPKFLYLGPTPSGQFCFYFVDDVSLYDCDNFKRKEFLGPDTILCSSQPLKLNAHQPESNVKYLWQNGSTADTLMAQPAGIYWAEVNINGCPPSRDTIVIQRQTPPTVNLGQDTIICLGKGFQIHNTPNVTDTANRYQWNTGDTIPSIFVDTVGKYILSIKNKGCVASDTINVFQYPLKKFDLGKDTTACYAVSYTLDATTLGSQGYRWSTGDTTPTIKVTKSGLYWGEAYNGSCKFRDSVYLTINPFPKVDLGPPFLAVCDNINFTLDAGNAGSTYKWNMGDTTQLYKVINTGSYKVDVTKNGCAAADSIDITVLPAPVVNLGPDTMLCEGASKLLDATNTGSSYLWQDFTTKATYLVTSQGLYKVRVTKGKCIATDSVYLSYTPKPIFTLGNDTSSCFETPLFFDVSSANASLYLWQDNTTLPTYQSTHDGLVWVQVTKDACVLRDSIVLTQLPVPLPDLGPDSFFCAGEDFTLNPGTSFTTYLWNDNSVSNKLKVNQPGTYWVVVTNNSGCKGKDSIALSVQQLPVVSLGKDTSLCEPNFILDAGSGFNAYQWQDGSTGTQLHVTDYGTYKVKVSGIRGCTNEAQITITNNCPTELFVPNAFTPNNDGNNEVFMPVGLNIKTFHMDIYNRWGQKVFTTDDITKGWNGKYNNEFAQVDVYVYLATYTNLKGTEFIKTGNVTLMK